jgi:hypothetical protein
MYCCCRHLGWYGCRFLCVYKDTNLAYTYPPRLSWQPPLIMTYRHYVAFVFGAVLTKGTVTSPSLCFTPHYLITNVYFSTQLTLPIFMDSRYTYPRGFALFPLALLLRVQTCSSLYLISYLTLDQLLLLSNVAWRWAIFLHVVVLHTNSIHKH